MVVQVPVADAAEVAAVSLFRLQVQVLEDVVDVVPVLHEKGVGMVDNYHLNRREEVVVALLDIRLVHDRTQTKWTG